MILRPQLLFNKALTGDGAGSNLVEFKPDARTPARGGIGHPTTGFDLAVACD
ncbi:hypothetical protein VD0002_g3660 [Verticillium dahliae]|nr:hypothetical protein VD0003_g5345 [Verticillium dahliae]PNH65326.1 hypothetical protein VD0002_g3660 [Verticillium dahliae]